MKQVQWRNKMSGIWLLLVTWLQGLAQEPWLQEKNEGHKNKATQGNTMKGINFNKGWDEWYCWIVVDKLVNCNLKYINYRIPTPITTSDTAIDSTGASGLYPSAESPHWDKNKSTPSVIVGTTTNWVVWETQLSILDWSRIIVIYWSWSRVRVFLLNVDIRIIMSSYGYLGHSGDTVLFPNLKF